eukprot:232108-Chlamydomonas_euryale.AAC.2
MSLGPGSGQPQNLASALSIVTLAAALPHLRRHRRLPLALTPHRLHAKPATARLHAHTACAPRGRLTKTRSPPPISSPRASAA